MMFWNIQRNRKRMWKLTILLALALTSGGHLAAQTDLLLTQQWFSRINMNPAATGNSENIDVFLLARQQWAGFENAPQSGVLNVHSYFDRIRSGVGLTAAYDKIGVGNVAVATKLAYAFHFNVGDWLVSLGLSGGAEQRVFDPTEQFFLDETDPDIPYEKISEWSPDVDFGFEIASERILAGASVTHLLRSSGQATTMHGARQYHAYLRYKQPVGDAVALIAGVRGSNFSEKYFVDASLTAMFFDRFWIGGAFRPDNAIAGFAGIQTGLVRIGYAYDHATGNTASLAKTSHEIMLSFKIGKPKRVINTKSPRFIEN